MAYNASEKYQAGESYSDGTAKQSNAGFLSDPVKAAIDILKYYAGARTAVTLPQLVGLLVGLKNGKNVAPSDDRKG